MSSQHIQSMPQALPHTQARPGALRTVLAQRLSGFGKAIWRALEHHGRRRANRELLDLADRCRDANPKLSRELRSYVRGGSSY